MKKFLTFHFIILMFCYRDVAAQNLWTLGNQAYVDNSGGGDFNAAFTGPPDRRGPFAGGFVNGGCTGFPNPCGDNSFNINPSRVTNGGAFRMTFDQVGATPQIASQVYYNNTINLASNFDMYFTLFFGCRNIAGGDGMVFLLTSTRQTPPNGTSGGGNLGFFSVNNSVGIEFDTYRNAVNNDPVEAIANSTDHVAIIRNGVVAHPATPSGTFPNGDGPFNLPNTIGRNNDGNIEDCALHSLRVTWNAGSKNLSAYLDGILVISSTVDVPAIIGTSNVFWGFSSGTQGTSNEQWFTYNGTSSPPSPPYDCNAAGTDVPGCIPVMPVEYLFFSAKAMGEVILLNWATSNEIENNYFRVLRSLDLLHWEDIGMVKGAGNSSDKNLYHFTDFHPYAGTNYYKLIQVDIDGKMNQTKVVEASLSVHQLNLLANPVSDNLIFSIGSDHSSIHVQMTDGLGRIVLDLKDLKRNHDYGFMIPVNSLSDGVYLLKVTTNTETYVTRIIKN